MIFKTTDLGKTWTEITNGIPADHYVHSVHTDPKRKNLLYAGTEQGVYVSFDDGANWQSLQLNLPLAPVYDTAVHGEDLIVATHGRALWVLDDIEPLRQATPEIAAEPVYLFTPEIAYRDRAGRGGGARARNSGQEPPSGAVIDYYASAAPTAPVTIEIADSRGQILLHSSSAEKDAGGDEERRPGARNGALPASAGLNRFVWNYRLDAPSEVPGMVISETSSGGPMVTPGNYQVKLTVGGKDYTAPLVVKADPRVDVSQEDFDKQYEFAVKLRDRVTEVHNTVNAIRAARASLELRKKADPSKAPQIDAVEQKMAAIEGQLIQVESVTRWADLVYPIELDAQYADLMNVVESADSAPPAQTYDVYKTYEDKREDLMDRWKTVQTQISQLGEK
jgi:hypothetical protein